MNEERLIKVGGNQLFLNTPSNCHDLDCQLRQDRAPRSVGMDYHHRVRP